MQPKLFQICTNWIFVIGLIFLKNKRHFQKKPRSKGFSYSSEEPGTVISKPSFVKGVSLVSRNLK